MLKSIRSKLILSYIILIIFAMAVTGLFLQRSFKTILEEELKDQVKSQCETYADLIHSRISGPDDFIQRSVTVVNEFVSDKKHSLRVYDLDGKIVGTPFLNIGEVMDWKSLLSILVNPETPARKRVVSFMTRDSLDRIRSWNPEDPVDINIKQSVVNSLDKIIERRDFYSPELFSDLELDDQAGRYLYKGINTLTPGEVRELNRKLIEAIFPFEISAGQFVPSLNNEKTFLSHDRLEQVKQGKVIHWYETGENGRILHVLAPVRLVSMSETEFIGITDLAASLTDIDSMYHRLTRQLLIAVAVSAFFTILISLILASTLTKPISQIRKVSEKIAAGDFSIRVDYKGKDEIRSLSDTINYMTGKIEANIAEITGEKDKMNALLSAMPEGVIALDYNGEILFLNSSACQFIHTEDKNYEGKKLLDLWNENEIREFLEEGKDKQELFSREVALPPLILKLHLVPFGERDRKVSGTMMIIRDITDLRRLEETRTRFLSSISHELRTPLTIIKGWIYTIKDEEPMLNFEEGRNALEIMDEETDRLTRLVNELLDLSRLRSKKLSIDMQTVKVDELVAKTFEQMSKNAERMNIAVSLEMENRDTELPADKDRMKQVIINLMDNAIKYTPSGGSVLIRTHRNDESWFMDVEDTGMGISRDELPFLFERFFRTKDKIKKKYIKGTGLGMAIVKEIVDAHKGSIDVESEEGKGTKIRIAIPLNAQV